jgi:hypothetical protein
MGICHLRTRPRRPRTNGKAERFIRIMLGGWAYGAIYSSSRERTTALDGWLFTYTHRRRHAGIGRHTPITRLNNLLGTYSERSRGSTSAENCSRKRAWSGPGACSTSSSKPSAT